MIDPPLRTPVASSPISVLLFAQALSTETTDAILAWRQYLDTLARPYEIFLIEETRPEVPASPLDNVPENAGPTRVFTYDRALGWRDALNEAIRSAAHPLIAFGTADKQYLPGELEHFLKSIDNVDLVAGYRVGHAPLWYAAPAWIIGLLGRVLIGLTPEPRECWLGGDGWGRRWVARWIFGVRLVDPECPFRLARREVFEHLPIQSGGPFAQVEILAKANHLSCLLMEEPVTWTPPPQPASAAIPFGQDARLVFRNPDFGAPKVASATT
jgi:glycosyltransferase involved in cell wall biosynthesis